MIKYRLVLVQRELTGRHNVIIKSVGFFFFFQIGEGSELNQPASCKTGGRKEDRYSVLFRKRKNVRG